MWSRLSLGADRQQDYQDQLHARAAYRRRAGLLKRPIMSVFRTFVTGTFEMHEKAVSASSHHDEAVLVRCEGGKGNCLLLSP